jgi:hypothetical protein
LPVILGFKASCFVFGYAYDPVVNFHSFPVRRQHIIRTGQNKEGVNVIPGIFKIAEQMGNGFGGPVQIKRIQYGKAVMGFNILFIQF